MSLSSGCITLCLFWLKVIKLMTFVLNLLCYCMHKSSRLQHMENGNRNIGFRMDLAMEVAGLMLLL